MLKEEVDLESNNPHALIQESQEIDGNNDIKKGNNEEIREVPLQAQDEQKPSQDRDMRDDDIHDFANAILPPKNQVEFYRKKSKYGIKGMYVPTMNVVDITLIYFHTCFYSFYKNFVKASAVLLKS